MIRKHWPVVFAVLAILISVVLVVFAYHSTDSGYAIFASVITFIFLLPLAGAVIGGWYGWRIHSLKKWLLPFAVYAGVILYMMIAGLILRADMFDADSYLTLGALPGLTGLVAEIVASVIAWVVKRVRNRR